MTTNFEEILLIHSDKGIPLPGLHQIMNHVYSNQTPIEHRGVRILFTGYLFNFDELNNQGYVKVEELIAELYMNKRLSDMTELFEGYFSAIIIDQEKITVLMDKYGIETGYYAHDTQRHEFIFSTSLQLINEYRGLKLDDNSIASYLLITDLPSDETMFVGINKCTRGEQLVYKNSILKTKKYGYINRLSAAQNINANKTNKIILKELDTLLQEIIDRKLSQLNTIPVCNLLSGGVDSSLIQAYLSRSEGRNRSICANIQGFGKEDVYSKDVADKLNSEHEVVQQQISDVITGMNLGIEQLMVPWIHIGEGMLNHLIENGLRNSGSVALFSGNGSDTLFGHGKAMRVANFCVNNPVISRFLFSLFARIDDKWKFAELISKADNDVSPKLGYELFVNKEAVQFLGEERVDKIISMKCDAVNEYPGRFIDRLYFTKIFDGEITWENSVLYKIAKSKKHFVVFPFTDEQLVQFVLAIPFKLKFYRNRAKYFPKKLLEQNIPKNLVYRKKVSKNTPWNDLFTDENRKKTASFYHQNYGQLMNESFLKRQIGRQGFEAVSLKLRNIYQLSQYLNPEKSGFS